jgi:DHA1 family bicyclomycin/chloramphenicol resistance-like MFS transporter
MAHSKPGTSEFICLMAVLMSLIALTIDAMLPALGQIGESLNVTDPNNTQWVVSTIFFGMSMGLMLYGPLSDSFGRKKSLYLGLGIFLVGDIVSLLSADLTTMLIGRFLQGFGGAACRVVTIAMIRDLFEGNKMARVMSLIMVFFILVPALAPSVGQLILFVGDWHAIFLFIFLVAFAGLLWLAIRQPETLSEDKRLAFSFSVIFSGIKETVTHRVTLLYIIAAGIMFGAFIGYLSSTQQILQIQYQLGDAFSIYFGSLALVIGFASFVNAKLVMSFDMQKLCLIALLVLTVNAAGFTVYGYYLDSLLSLWQFLLFISITFFCFGILFGNFNALAVAPLGHIAGIANSIISALQTFISVAIGGFIGQMYDGTVMPLVVGFFACGASSVVLMLLIRQRNSEA